MLEEGDYGGGFAEGREVLGCKGWPAVGGRGWREDRGGGDVRGKSCEEVIEGVECCESLGEGVGTHGDGTLLWVCSGVWGTSRKEGYFEENPSI